MLIAAQRRGHAVCSSVGSVRCSRFGRSWWWPVAAGRDGVWPRVASVSPAGLVRPAGLGGQAGRLPGWSLRRLASARSWPSWQALRC